MYGLSPIRFVSPSFTTNSLGPNDPKVGDLMTSGNEMYRFVYNGGGSQISTGQGCIMTGVSGFSVTVSSTTSVDLLVGICKHATIAAGYYGYVVVNGITPVVLSANVSATAGKLLILAADGNFVPKTISTDFVSPGLVKTLDAIATGASGNAYCQLL